MSGFTLTLEQGIWSHVEICRPCISIARPRVGHHPNLARKWGTCHRARHSSFSFHSPIPLMDFVKDLAGGNAQQQQDGGAAQGGEGGGGGGNFMDKLSGMANNAAGGGQAGEAKEDYLDKGVDFVQERFMGQGDQSNENAIEQQKDEMISDQIRSQYKGMTGSDFPIKDKE